jgi:hypothetical protein
MIRRYIVAYDYQPHGVLPYSQGNGRDHRSCARCHVKEILYSCLNLTEIKSQWRPKLVQWERKQTMYFQTLRRASPNKDESTLESMYPEMSSSSIALQSLLTWARIARCYFSVLNPRKHCLHQVDTANYDSCLVSMQQENWLLS